LLSTHVSRIWISIEKLKASQKFWIETIKSIEITEAGIQNLGFMSSKLSKDSALEININIQKFTKTSDLFWGKYSTKFD